MELGVVLNTDRDGFGVTVVTFAVVHELASVDELFKLPELHVQGNGAEAREEQRCILSSD